MSRAPRLAWILLVIVAACGPDAAMPPAPGVSAGGELTGGACEVELAMPPSEGNRHVPLCAQTAYESRPPSSGAHYGTWPVFRVYDQPVPWGFLVHGLEHGAVVIAHNCPDGCPQELAQVRELYAAAAPRPACPRPPVIVTPDPTLDVPFAASAWGATLRARCFDRQRFATFVERYRDRGPELFPSDCGATDLEASGWCPAAMP